MTTLDKPHLLLLPHDKPVLAYAYLHQRLRSSSTMARREAAAYRTPTYQLPTEWSKAVNHAVVKDKGFSFHDHIGDGPTGGYMVSVDKGSEQVVPLRNFHPDDIADYRDVHQQELADPNNYLGGWVYKGKVFLDVSRHEDDEAQALALARKHNQLGIYDLAKGTTVLTNETGQRPGQSPQQPLQPAASLMQRGAALVLGHSDNNA